MSKSYLRKLNLRDAIELYYEANEFTFQSGLSAYIETLNEVMQNLTFLKDDNSFENTNNYISKTVFRIAEISTFLSKACEKFSAVQLAR